MSKLAHITSYSLIVDILIDHCCGDHYLRHLDFCRQTTLPEKRCGCNAADIHRDSQPSVSWLSQSTICWQLDFFEAKDILPLI